MADARADQYSLCLVWLEALTRPGDRDRDRDDDDDDRGRAVDRARGPRWLRRLLRRGLAIDPTARWPSIDALLAAIERRRARGRRGLLAAVALVVIAAVAVAMAMARTRTPAVATDDAIVIRRHQLGDGAWRMTMTPDGGALVRTQFDRTSLWLEDRATGAATALPLPPEVRVSRRMDALPGASRDGAVVLVRMTDGSLWRTGRRERAALRLGAAAGGAACLHGSGDRAVVSEPRAPIEIRATDDGRRLGTGPQADLCAWLGDRLVLGLREPHGGELRILEPDGRLRLIAILAGELGSIAVDGRGRIVAAHATTTAAPVGRPHVYTGLLTAVAADGPAPPRVLRRTVGRGYAHLVATDDGLFVARIEPSIALHLGRLPGPGAGPGALVMHAVADDADGTMTWLDGDRLAFSHLIDGVVSQHASGWPWRRVEQVRGRAVAASGAGLVILHHDDPRALRPRCRLTVRAGGRSRPVRDWPCQALFGITCDGGDRCVLGWFAGDDVRFDLLTLADGVLHPTTLVVPRSDTPNVMPFADGRWLIERAGALTIHRVDAPTAGGAVLAVTALAAVAGVTDVTDATWDADGQGILAARCAELTCSLVRIGRDGRVEILLESPQQSFARPRVSADGRWLAVAVYVRHPAYVMLPIH